MHDRGQDKVQLKLVEDDDLQTFWQQLSDPQLQHMAGVTRRYHYDRGAFDQFWAKIRTDPAVLVRTITADDEIVGHAATFGPPAEREITYVIGRRHWGRGIATAALGQMLVLDHTRPMHADVVADNAGSLRVLTKHGFDVTDQRREYAGGRGADVDVLRLSLSATAHTVDDDSPTPEPRPTN